MLFETQTCKTIFLTAKEEKKPENNDQHTVVLLLCFHVGTFLMIAASKAQC